MARCCFISLEPAAPPLAEPKLSKLRPRVHGLVHSSTRGRRPARHSEFPLSSGPRNQGFGSALVDDLDVVAVRIEYPCGVVARVVLQTCPGRRLALASRIDGCLVECIYLCVIERFKSYMDRVRVGLPLFQPEEGSLSVTEPLQVGVSIVALVISEIGDPEGLQGLSVECNRALETANREDNMINHKPPRDIGRAGNSSQLPCRSVGDGEDPVLIPNHVDDLHFLRCELAFEEACPRSRDNGEEHEVQAVNEIELD
jgi:hypothetical protein